MKQLKHRMLVSTLATALTLGGTFTGIVHSAFADETAPAAQSDGTADSGSTAAAPAATTTTSSTPAADSSSDNTIDGLSIPVFAKVHGVDLRLGKAALSTAVILDEDVQDVYAAMAGNKTLLQIGTGGGASSYLSQLIAMTQQNISAAVTNGNLTAQQASILSNYAQGVLNSEVNDSNYRDNDPSTSDSLVDAIFNDDTAYGADVAQLFGLSQDDLITEVNAGKSLGAIAAEKGVSDSKLVALLQTDGLLPSPDNSAPPTTTTSAPASAPANTSDDDSSD